MNSAPLHQAAVTQPTLPGAGGAARRGSRPPRLRHLVASLLASLALATATASLHAGGGEILHSTEKPKIDLQVELIEAGRTHAKKPKDPSKPEVPFSETPEAKAIKAEMEKDKITRTTVGIGEVITLKIKGEKSAIGDPEKTQWKIENSSTDVDLAAFSNGSESIAVQDEQPTSVTGSKATLKIKIIDLTPISIPDRFFTVIAIPEKGPQITIEFYVEMPVYWSARNCGSNTTKKIENVDPENPSGVTLFYVGNDLDLLCSPSDVNFENISYQESDGGSPLDIRPENNEEVVDFFEKYPFTHKTGDAAGASPAGGIHSIDYSFNYVRDGVAGPGFSGNQTRSQRIEGIPADTPTPAEGKEFLDKHRYLSFAWHCTWGFFGDKPDEYETAGHIDNPPLDPYENKGKLQYHLNDAPPTDQVFIMECWPNWSYSTTITKFGTYSKRTIDIYHPFGAVEDIISRSVDAFTMDDCSKHNKQK
jgi:hypothetical protein